MKHLLQLCLAVMLTAFVAGCKKQPTAGDQPTTDYGSSRDAVVQAIKSGKLQANSSGVVVLPPEWQSLSMNGQVYTATDPSAGLLVLFPIMKGPGSVECSLYAEKALPAGAGTRQVGSFTVRLSGQSSGNWHQARIPSVPGR